MNIAPNPKIRELAAELKLSYIKSNWHELASDTSLSHEEYLLELLTGEYDNRLKNGMCRRIKEAKFPMKKYLCDFDRTKYSTEFLPEFEELETLDFILYRVGYFGLLGGEIRAFRKCAELSS
jgi:DNA replication protein DnaC